MTRQTRLSSGDWPLLTSLSIGVAVGAALVLTSPWSAEVDSVARQFPCDPNLKAYLGRAINAALATIAAHLAFTSSVSLLSWIAGPWIPRTRGPEETRIGFLETEPPRFSMVHGGCVALALLDLLLFSEHLLGSPRIYLNFALPHDGLRLMLLATLAMGVALSWGRWLINVGRLHVGGGMDLWAGRFGTQKLSEIFVSARTVLGASEDVAVAIRLPGARHNQVWQRDSIGEPPPNEDYRTARPPTAAPKTGRGSFFASFEERASITSANRPAFTWTVGGLASRWTVLLPWTLLCGLGASRVLWGMRPKWDDLSRVSFDAGVVLLVGAALILTPVVGVLHAITKCLLTDVDRERGGEVLSGEWLWKLLGPEEPRDVRLSRVMFGQHLADSIRRRVGVAFLLAGLWLITGLTLGAAGLLVFVCVSSDAWFLPWVLLPTAILWITMTSYRLRVRIKDGLLAMRIGGAWLPVTRVDAEGDAIVLSAGPLRVRARELTGFNKARDPADTASLIWPFCAPASAFLSTEAPPKLEGSSIEAHRIEGPKP